MSRNRSQTEPAPERNPNRHQQRKAATHQKLLEAARAVIIERGYNAVEILDITERANVSKAAFYRHFTNKEACVREIMLNGFDALLERIFEGGRRATSREEWVSTSFREAFAWAEQNREILLIMVGGRASAQLNVFGRDYLVQSVERAFDEFGSFSEDDGVPVVVKAHVTAGALIQLLGWWLENDTGYSAGDMADLMRRVLLHGVGLISP